MNAREQFVTTQKLAGAFSAMFVGIVAFSHIAGAFDPQGMVLGLFQNSLYADSIHLGSATWAAAAAWRSERAARLYFQLFGSYYTADATIYFLLGLPKYDLLTDLALNLPHFIIGPIALWIGFVLSRKLKAWDA
ncbi:MAG: hypothetical protein NTZ05_12835 [Chloroflexi bacterium]|nr:hypothetical protein [Chloroflexota bacterium]